CNIGLEHTQARRMSFALTHRSMMWFQVDPLTLVVPIGSLVDGLHFRKHEFVAFELKRAFPLHFGRADHIVAPRLPVGGRRAMQIDQLVRYEFEGFAVLSVVAEERLLYLRVV